MRAASVHVVSLSSWFPATHKQATPGAEPRVVQGLCENGGNVDIFPPLWAFPRRVCCTVFQDPRKSSRPVPHPEWAATWPPLCGLLVGVQVAPHLS